MSSPRRGDESHLGLGEGDTPLVRLPTLERRLGVAELWAKLETCNPTGSYKDRIAAATIRTALEQGLTGWVAPHRATAAARSPRMAHAPA